MQAVLVRAFGGPEVLKLEELPDPAAGPGQVRVRVHAVGVNPFDTYVRSGTYALKPALPYIPGADAAGVIDQVGAGVEDLRAGDRVYLCGTVLGKTIGAYAALAVCTPDQVHKLPAGVSFSQGAALGVPYATAWRALFGRAQARAGETVLIHGASGGVGVAAVQFARAAGLTVIGTAGSDAGLALVTAEGAHHVVNHRADGYLDEITALTGGKGPDLILEMLANVNLDHDLAIAARYGRIVIIGSRGPIQIEPRKIMARDLSIYGATLWGASAEELAEAHRAIGAGLAKGTLSPAVGVELPLADAATAHVQVMEPGARGKIVLVP